MHVKVVMTQVAGWWGPKLNSTCDPRAAEGFRFGRDVCGEDGVQLRPGLAVVC